MLPLHDLTCSSIGEDLNVDISQVHSVLYDDAATLA
jgi:hypothetical protein